MVTHKRKHKYISHVTRILFILIETSSTSEDASSEPVFPNMCHAQIVDQQLVPHRETGRLQLVPH